MTFRFHPYAELELNFAITYYEECQEHLDVSISFRHFLYVFMIQNSSIHINQN